MDPADDRDPSEEDEAAVVTDSRPRVTRLYGAVDIESAYPATMVDGQLIPSGEQPAVMPPTRAMTAPSPVVGSMLERYRIGDVLGQGGMGEVLSARDEQIGRPVAIKRLRVENPSAEVLARFLREARIQGRLEHPAVVPVHELWNEGGQPFFVMKQLAGTTLADVIPKLALRDKRAIEDYTLQRLLRAFTDACLAVEFAHTRRVVHRDLKPANIVLGDFGEVYVLDWGIARITEDQDEGNRDSFADIGTVAGTETIVGAILGTPGYISPEQIRGDYFLDGRADVYSLGCILFELLALQPLHPRGQAGLASALAGAADARPTVRAPSLETPPELDAVCVKATQLDPAHRFETARGLGDAVQAFLDGNRDVALRRDLAKQELATARKALREGDGPIERRDALRAAARALALDPTDREPADLVGHLMLEPPKDIPDEVVRELEGLDLEALRTSARFGMLAAFAYLAFFPILYWVGFRELWYNIAGPAICIAIILDELLLAPKHPYLSGYIALVGNLSMFVLFGWMVSPIVIGPGPAIITVTLMATHRRLIRPWLLALLTCIATLTPWLLELAGAMEPRVTVSGGTLHLTTAATELDPSATLAGLFIYIVALIHLAALLSRLQDDDRRSTRRAMQLQSWQLRQLVPRPQSKPPR